MGSDLVMLTALVLIVPILHVVVLCICVVWYLLVFKFRLVVWFVWFKVNLFD